MQYWVFFIGGVGGDGFANLLEHGTNITPVDRKLEWRLRRQYYPEEKVAFSCATYLNPPFKGKIGMAEIVIQNKTSASNLDLIEPTEYYRYLVDSKINTVITAHSWKYNFHINQSKYKNCFEEQQHKIWLYSLDTARIIDDFCVKNSQLKSVQLGTFQIVAKQQFARYKSPLYGTPDLNYDTFIDIELVWDSWDYLNNILSEIGIDLDRKYYEEYLDISQRRKKLP